MKKKVLYLMIAIIGNALGTALMKETYLGMTAWGSSALNLSNYLGISIGSGFVILSVFFYMVAVLLAKKFKLKDMVYSFVFLFSFAYLSDLFIWWIPDLSNQLLLVRIVWNVIGLLILLFSIALHLQIQIAVHPMDVFLYEMQDKMKSVLLGTYSSYLIAFTLGIAFGSFSDTGIQGIGMGTLMLLLFSGYIMDICNTIINKYM